LFPEIPEEIEPEKLSLALEPEAAAIYCQNMTQQELAPHAKATHPYTSSAYMVVDIGGGTVDITAHQVSSMPSHDIKVINTPAGNDCGGSSVNDNFKKFLESLVGDEDFSEYIASSDESTNASNAAYLNELVNETFEKQKLLFAKKAEPGSKFSVRLHISFMEVYKARLEKGIQVLKDSRIELSGVELRIKYSKMEEFFKPVVSGILQCITEAMKDLEEETKMMYLVGGFGGCPYLYKAVSEHFGDKYTYVTPAKSDFAVVRGAVLFRLNPDIVHARKANATYGVRANIPFEEGKHEEEYKWYDENGTPMCQNVFSTFIERGDTLNTSEIFLKSYAAANSKQTRMHIDIYSSPETDVWYITGIRPKSSSGDFVDVQKVGEVIVPFQIDEKCAQAGDTELKTQRKIDVTFDFSHTEIQVKGYDPISMTEVKVVLDLLST